MKDELRELLPALRRYAYSLTSSMPDADDLLQATVERLLTRKVPEDAVLTAWAFRVCRNIWIDEHRSRQVREKAMHDPSLQQADVMDGENHIHQQMALEKVSHAMEGLKDDQREIISLVALEGYSYKEVAKVLSIPVGTVMSRLARARATLAEQLTWTH